MNYYGIVFIVGGLFSIVCAAMDFDWFMNHRRARFFVRVFKRNGARIFYVVIGLVLAALGFLLLFKVVS
jgi:small neutral amino acid transporter SnatA (MarC family)